MSIFDDFYDFNRLIHCKYVISVDLLLISLVHMIMKQRRLFQSHSKQFLNFDTIVKVNKCWFFP